MAETTPPVTPDVTTDTLGNAFSELIRFKVPSLPPRTAAIEALASGPAKQRLIYILLAVLLGNLGIHNFYAGYTKRAIAELICGIACGLISLLGLICLVPCIFGFVPWVFWIFDIIKIKTDAAGRDFC